MVVRPRAADEVQPRLAADEHADRSEQLAKRYMPRVK
jgi:hypothetical protein